MASKYSFVIDELKKNTSHGIILGSVRPGSTVLECGSSEGYMTKYMKEKLSAKVSIVELDEEAFLAAREFAEDGICANLEGDEWLDYYRGRQFDYILFADVLEHLRDPQTTLKRAADLLKPDGMIIVSIPNVAHADILINLLNNRWNYMALGLLDDTHIHFWAAENLEELFNSAGLSPIEKDYAIIPAFMTEQKNTDIAEELESAVLTICQRPFSDVYQFVFKLQKEEHVNANGIICIDRYEERHRDFGKESQYYDTLKNKKENERTALNEKYEDLQRRYETAVYNYEAISNAFFWKISEPLRRIINKIRLGSPNNESDYNPSLTQVEEEIIADDNKVEADCHDPNVSTNILCTKHTRFIGLLIQSSLKKVGIAADVLTEEPPEYGDNMYIVVCPQMFQRLPKHYISFQMEQTVSSRWLNEDCLNRLKDSFAVLDYSLVNIEYFQKHTDFFDKFYYLPVDYLPGIRREQDDYEYDVVFYGDPNNDRRQAALEKLGRRFNVKVISEVYGEELYSLLNRAKVVVNIHYYENAMLETTRLYETLSLGASVIVSERSTDYEEDMRLEGIVDFVQANDFEAMADRVDYWLSHEEARRKIVNRNNDLLAGRPNSFDFYFLRFLLANEWLSFDDFYRLAGDYVHFDTNHVCISLPESIERRREFRAEIRDKKIEFEIFPALRHHRAWTGCGLSYKFIMKKAQEQNIDRILLCEDDVLLPDDFDYRWEQCEKYLNSRDDWDLFQGFMADIGDETITAVNNENGQTFVHMNHMISAVLNYYRKSIFARILAWDERNDEVDTNTIDRALESQDLRVVCTNPFLVGHKEDLDSDIWNFKNSHYIPLIESSIKKLNKLVEEFEA